MPRIIRSSGAEFLVLILSGAVLVLVLEWVVMSEPIFDHEKLDVYRLSIEYVAASYEVAKALNGDSINPAK